jgi:hypothetical protein
MAANLRNNEWNLENIGNGNGNGTLPISVGYMNRGANHINILNGNASPSYAVPIHKNKRNNKNNSRTRSKSPVSTSHTSNITSFAPMHTRKRGTKSALPAEHAATPLVPKHVAKRLIRRKNTVRRLANPVISGPRRLMRNSATRRLNIMS